MNQEKIPYDSTEETKKHIFRVAELISKIVLELLLRMERHDASKLKSPEKETFDIYTPKLKATTYGSEEYKTYLKEMQKILDIHYVLNTHHPEHYFSQGISGMDLVDLIEMLCDWKAATERHANGDIEKSILINKERFGISDQLVAVLQNTIAKFPIYDKHISNAHKLL